MLSFLSIFLFIYLLTYLFLSIYLSFISFFLYHSYPLAPVPTPTGEFFSIVLLYFFLSRVKCTGRTPPLTEKNTQATSGLFFMRQTVPAKTVCFFGVLFPFGFSFLFLFWGKKKRAGFLYLPLLPLRSCGYYLDTIFLKILIPVVTTIIEPTIGSAIGSTSPIIPVTLDATLVKLVVNAVTTPSICFSPFFSFTLYVRLIIFINPCIATPMTIGIQPMTKPIGIDVTNSCPTSSRDSVIVAIVSSASNASISIYSPSFNYGNI